MSIFIFASLIIKFNLCFYGHCWSTQLIYCQCDCICPALLNFRTYNQISHLSCIRTISLLLCIRNNGHTYIVCNNRVKLLEKNKLYFESESGGLVICTDLIVILISTSLSIHKRLFFKTWQTEQIVIVISIFWRWFFNVQN